MTTAILLALAPADTGGPASALPVGGEPALRRLAAQLRRHGADQVVVITRPEWLDGALAAEDVALRAAADTGQVLDEVRGALRTGEVLLGHAELVVQAAVVDGLLRDPRIASGVLAATGRDEDPGALGMRVARGRVVSAESPYHATRRPNARFRGLLKLTAADRPVLERVLDELASITRTGLPESWEEELRRKTERWGRDFLREAGGDLGLADVLSRTTGTKAWFADAEAVRDRIDREFERAVVLPAAHAREDVLSLVLTGLVRRDLRLTCSYVRELVCVRVLDAAAAQLAEEQLERTDEDRVLLDAAVKAKDGFFTTFLVSPYSKYLARWAARRGLTPNQVTSASMLLGVAAAAAFATGQRWGLVTGAVLLQLAFTTDCVDGQLARYSRQFSKLGAWLDSVFDRGKEYVVYAGLAVGATRVGDATDVWLLAAAALTLQSFRHFVDFSYGAQQHGALDVVDHPPLSEPFDEAPTQWEWLGEQPSQASALRRLARGGIRLSHAFERAAPLKWAKRILVLPIGERFALISLSAALGGPRLTFTLLLAWGAVASVYTITGRVLRSLS